MAGITYLDYYIPEKELTVPELLEQAAAIPPTFNSKKDYAEFLESILKLKGVRVETQLNAAEMMGGLIAKMFDRGQITPEEIDLIMFVQEPDIIPQKNVAKYLQHQYKMKNAYILNVSGNLCANNEIALDVANAICTARHHVHNILIVSVSRMETLEERLFGTYAVGGDAAGIMLFSKEPRDGFCLEIVDNLIMSDGSFYDVDVNVDNSLVHCKSYAMCIMDLMKKSSITPDSVEKIIVPNANVLLVSQCLAAAGLKGDKLFLDNQGKYGHMDTVDFVINLSDLMKSETFKRQGSIFSFGTGSTGTYISTLLSFDRSAGKPMEDITI